ncbi:MULTISPECIES: amino acid ABC transporter permease [Moorena]|uniref:Amino acid ABC transporter, membrane protein n=1 Tax=Moorena producens 3L TaxID=489825 RepID=F4XUS9_9CYAN|nr:MULTISPECIES: amino acid ABC transporter permease [Moorena]NEQ13083.1 amino acid ABC transporter permease [Moorena sp. SIO3E2]EGJ31632.1 amino acid ABC transporter, membrane protein [Moorena producens 3L]NEP33931.1 amino acid ABC transporter permease [Moorena sp. SIO3B2]NEP68984.1 amino acid ABC transporter permease [Moorena sp. SIO3A5]NEQ06105.1 amino acid ABC transporter permease [Moorena sp. SIO4E2]
MTTVNSQPPELAPPPELQVNPVTWIKKNLFSTWYNSILTVTVFGFLFVTVKGLITWATTEAQWDVIKLNFRLFFVGTYPATENWRPWLILGIIVFLSGITWGVLARNVPTLFSRNVLIALVISGAILVLFPVAIPYRLLLLGIVVLLVASAWGAQQVAKTQPKLGNWLPLAWFIALLIFLWLLGGGLGLKQVSTNQWSGLLLNVLAAVVSILICFPLGVLLALGRQSTLPVVRGFSILYIELIRGLPLIAILFMGQVIIPLFLPQGMRPDRVLRAIIGLTLFSAAYLAENVRGGLQSIPTGQIEAAKALGLNTPLSVGLIVLPQALKAVIPAIVGQFISLFQDTTLLFVVGLVELLGIGDSIFAQAKFETPYQEVYLFDGVLFWLFCYAMSTASRRLEKQLNVDH